MSEPTVEVTLELADAEATRALGRRLAPLLRRGDLVVLNGELGAGKTTLTQGLGAGLDVRGQVTSPSFIIARVHPARSDGPDLVHVDAYRLGSPAEVDQLDLDTSLEESVTVVEWGTRKVEMLADDRLEVELRRPRGAAATPDGEPLTGDSPRQVVLRGYGHRWVGVLDGLTGR